MSVPWHGSRMVTTQRHVRQATLLLAAVAVLGCAEPALPDSPQGDGAPTPLEALTPDPARDMLVTQLAELRDQVVAVRGAFGDIGEATDVATARRRAGTVVALLADVPGAPEADGRPPLFPAATTERGSIDGDDLITLTLTAARDAGGDLGRAVVELLRDPVGGDLGSWQRDPAGVIATVEATADPGTSIGQLEGQVLELPGEGTRALAWALLAADAGDLDDARAYAERGAAHTDLIVRALDDLLAEDDAT